jgi:predicted O-methyltransferase YrrM
MVEEVIAQRGAQHAVQIEQLRKKLRSEQHPIVVSDLGAGSRNGKNGARAIAEFARRSATRTADAALLQRLVDHMACKNVLELGTNLGLTTAYLAAAKSKPQVLSIEGDPALAALARKHLGQLDVDAEVITGSFESQLSGVLAKLHKVDFAYIDGNHRKVPTLQYFEQIKQHIHDKSLIVVGDIHWSKDMEEAWRAIKDMEGVTVTVDLFYMGLVFFRKEQAHEHFILKHP